MLLSGQSMNKVEVIDAVGGEATTGTKPFMVKVNGEVLRDKRGVGRRFGDSIAACLAGTREVDRLRSQSDAGAAK